jgi:hypothetical protein
MQNKILPYIVLVLGISALSLSAMLCEIPNNIQWFGGAIALAGIYIVNQSRLQSQEERPNA